MVKKLSRTRSASLLYALFFVSGATTLIYEISWTRQTGLLFGHTVLGASVVLASLFLGLAIGYWVGGRVSFVDNTLCLFGICEIIAAIWAFCVPPLLSALQSPSVIQWMTDESVTWQLMSRASAGILLLLPATVALGATLPLMTHALSKVSACPARTATIGYTCNTAGAMFGTLLCTYLLLVRVGVARSSYLAAGIGVTIGAIAIIFSRNTQSHENLAASMSCEPLADVESVTAGNPQPRSVLAVVMAISSISGFVTLALEILYTRLFSLVFHNSTYTFGNVVAVFLLALAVGAASVVLAQRKLKAEFVLFWCAILGAISCCLFLALFVHMTSLDYFVAGETFGAHLLLGFGLVLSFVLVPVTVCGMVFPATWKVLESKDATGWIVGLLAMSNAVGAAVGSLAASFVLLPAIGLWGSFLAVASLLTLIAIFASMLAVPKYKRSAVVMASTCIAGTWLLTPNWSLMGRDRDEVFLTRRESAYGWIDVTRNKSGSAWYIRQNLHYRLGGTGSAAMRERRQARLPMLLHPDPERVLFLGMGTGVTAAGAIQHPKTESIEIVELIADVTAAAKEIGHRNDYVLEDNRVHVTTDDARHFLLRTEERFDVIISDLFVPWESETGYLYTREHYAASANRLNPGGLFCQWLPVYQMGRREFELIANTMASVFPETTLWWGKMDPSKPIIGLVGSMRPIEIDTTILESRLNRLRNLPGGHDPQLATLDDFRLASIGRWRSAEAPVLNLDEFPRVEFWTPRSLMAGELLRGAWLARFHEEVLMKLPPASIKSEPEKFFRNSADIQGGRQTQRFLIFGL